MKYEIEHKVSDMIMAMVVSFSWFGFSWFIIHMIQVRGK